MTSNNKRIARGGYTYERIITENGTCLILIREDGHRLGVIKDADGAWGMIEAGADPVKDCWKDGYGHAVAKCVSVFDLIGRVIEYAADHFDTDLSFEYVHKTIIGLNDAVIPAVPYNDTVDDLDVRCLAQYMVRLTRAEEVDE